MGKNTGKTETLNYILRGLPSGLGTAVTSVGTDGEGRDHVYGTRKPVIRLRAGTVFATAENYYRSRRIAAELLDVDVVPSAAGRIATARALSDGEVILSGPPTTDRLVRWKHLLDGYGVKFMLVDGALSRMSSASPAVSDAIVLATGAALSADIKKVVYETVYAAEKIALPLADREIVARLAGLPQGVWIIDGEGNIAAVEASSLTAACMPENVSGDYGAVYVAGAFTERFAETLRAAKVADKTEVVVDDFTKIFLSAGAYGAFVRAGGRISVLRRSELAAVTVNPVAPSGFSFDPDRLRDVLSEAVRVPVYNVMRI